MAQVRNERLPVPIAGPAVIVVFEVGEEEGKLYAAARGVEELEALLAWIEKGELARLGKRLPEGDLLRLIEGPVMLAPRRRGNGKRRRSR